MKLFVLFGQQKESYDGEHAPAALLVWDEYAVDENPEGFEKDVEKTKATYREDMIAMRVVAVEVDQDKIRRLLLSTPTIPGEIT